MITKLIRIVLSLLFVTILLQSCDEESQTENQEVDRSLDVELVGRWYYDDILYWEFMDNGDASQYIAGNVYEWEWETIDDVLYRWARNVDKEYATVNSMEYYIESGLLYMKIEYNDEYIWSSPMSKQ